MNPIKVEKMVAQGNDPLIYLECVANLRHFRNVLSEEDAANLLNINEELVKKICDSRLHGASDLYDIINDEDPEGKISEMVQNQIEAEKERERIMEEVRRRHEEAIQRLYYFRDNACGIGTRKLKVRLNKLAKRYPIAQAIRKALEIEEVNIKAKETPPGKFRDKKYTLKERYLEDLIKLFRDEGWTYGFHLSGDLDDPNVLYFEIPGMEQISWHSFLILGEGFPKYEKEWDGKVNSTLWKLEDGILYNFPEIAPEGEWNEERRDELKLKLIGKEAMENDSNVEPQKFSAYVRN